MKSLIKFMVWILVIPVSIYLIVLVTVYFFQEKLIFIPDVLPANYVFKFDNSFEEKSVETADHKKLDGLLFKVDSSRGIVFFLHGNAGAINYWGFVSEIYKEMNYDFFILDYRGYGKSEGKIKNENQLYDDVQRAYSMIAKEYDENQIIIVGQSLGTGLATKLAEQNNPKKLILISPYYSFSDLVCHKFRIVPDFLLKYKFPTNEFIIKVKAPIVIFHGNKDRTIYVESAVKLKKLCKPNDQLFILENLGHNGINDNAEFQKKLKEVLK